MVQVDQKNYIAQSCLELKILNKKRINFVDLMVELKLPMAFQSDHP